MCGIDVNDIDLPQARGEVEDTKRTSLSCPQALLRFPSGCCVVIKHNCCVETLQGNAVACMMFTLSPDPVDSMTATPVCNDFAAYLSCHLVVHALIATAGSLSSPSLSCWCLTGNVPGHAPEKDVCEKDGWPSSQGYTQPSPAQAWSQGWYNQQAQHILLQQHVTTWYNCIA